MKKKVHSESEKVKAVYQLESGLDASVVVRENNMPTFKYFKDQIKQKKQYDKSFVKKDSTIQDCTNVLNIFRNSLTTYCLFCLNL